VIGSIVQGWSRVLHAPWLSAGALAAAILLLKLESAATTYALGTMEGLTAPGWMAVANDTVVQIARLFTTEVDEFGRRLTMTSRFASGEPLMPAMSAYLLVSAVLWAFLAGGVIDRLARGRRLGAGPFFWACGVHAGRFLRLGLLIGPIYWAVFQWVQSQAVLVAAFCALNLIADFTMVRTVVEDRRSVLGSIAAALRFIRRRIVRVVALYLANVVVLIALAAVWALITRAAVEPSVAIISVYVFMLLRTWALLAFTASEVAFFQGELAHAHYTAAPQPRWPDSPAVEAIENLTRRTRAAGTARDVKSDA